MYAWGTQLYLAPTWDRGEPWLSTLRHIAKEGRVYVVGCCSVVRRDDIPDRFAFKQRFLPEDLEWLNPGASAIMDPDGKVVAGPLEHKEDILYATVARASSPGRASSSTWPGITGGPTSSSSPYGASGTTWWSSAPAPCPRTASASSARRRGDRERGVVRIHNDSMKDPQVTRAAAGRDRFRRGRVSVSS